MGVLGSLRPVSYSKYYFNQDEGDSQTLKSLHNSMSSSQVEVISQLCI